MSETSWDDAAEAGAIAYHEALLAKRRGDATAATGEAGRDCPAGVRRCLELLEAIWRPARATTSEASVSLLLESSRHAAALSAESRAALRPRVGDSAESEAELRRLADRGVISSIEAVQLIRFDGRPLQLDRFVLLEEIGRGGMGVVYRAHDPVFGRDVALKTMVRSDPTSLKRLKQEFRGLADLSHPNLTTLYGLHRVGEHWFITMEHVPGVSLDRFVRGEEAHAACRPLVDPTACERLESALQQVEAALRMLHESGKCHCDLKPSNIRVRPDGQVKLLDFGLVSELSDAAGTLAAGGTLAYMAPEVLAGERPTPASDWYSLGRLTHELLCGELPTLSRFAERSPSVQEMVQRWEDVELPRRALPLAARCARWLSPRPEDRLDAPSPNRVSATTAWPSPARSGRFIGRSEALAVLCEAQAGTAAGFEAAVIAGPTGAGKSRLAAHLLAELASQPEPPLIFSGRCLPRDATPFKAFDLVMEQVAGRLATEEWSDLTSPSLLQAAAALGASFPALLESLAALGIPSEAPAGVDQATSFVNLFAELAQQRRTVILIDDVQWADADSLAWLAALLSAAPRGVLLLATHRGQPGDARELVESWFGDERDAAAVRGFAKRLRLVSLPPLSPDEARDLLGDAAGTAVAKAAERLLSTAAGNPFWIEQLAAVLRDGGTDVSEAVSAAELVRRRIAALPSPTRRLLALLAVAGLPLTLADLGELQPEDGDLHPKLISLESSRLIQAHGPGPEDWIEPAHDQIRAAMADLLTDDEQRGLHRTLAATFAGRSEPPVEFIATHFLEAGEPQAALPYVVEAGARAQTRRAYREAAQWHRRALEIHREPIFQEIDLEARLGECLVHAGFGPEAADLLLTAASRAAPTEAGQLRQLAGVHLLRIGHFVRGLRLLQHTLAELGVRLHSSKFSAERASQLRRPRSLHRRLAELRPPDACDPRDLQALDLGFELGKVLSHFDNLRAADLADRILTRAFRVGEPVRAAFALVLRGVFLSYQPQTRDAGKAELHEAERLSEKFPVPFLRGTARLGIGLHHWLAADWRTSVRILDEAAAIYRDECPERVWDFVFARSKAAYGQFYLGRLGELTTRADAIWEDAVARSDLYSQNEATSLFFPAWLVRDEPAAGLEALARPFDKLPSRSLEGPQFFALMARLNACLYLGDFEQAAQLMARSGRCLPRTASNRLELFRGEMAWMQARAASGLLLSDQRTPVGSLRTLRRATRRLADSTLPAMQALGALADGLWRLHWEGPIPGAERLRQAAAANRSVGQRFHAAAALILATRACPDLELSAADSEHWQWRDWMAAEGVVQPEQMLNVYLPLP